MISVKQVLRTPMDATYGASYGLAPELSAAAKGPLDPADMADGGSPSPHALPALAAADSDAAALLQRVTRLQDGAKMELMVSSDLCLNASRPV